MDESLAILLFVCLPMSVLLIGALIYHALMPSPFIAEFPNFRFKINTVGREEAYINYRDDNRSLEFPAQMGRRRSISIKVPREISEAEARNITANLVLGLTSLRYRYTIFRTGEPEPIPEERREAAIAELRKLGFEIESSYGSVSRAVTRNFQPVPGKDPRELLARVQELLPQTGPTREPIVILARSENLPL